MLGFLRHDLFDGIQIHGIVSCSLCGVICGCEVPEYYLTAVK